MADYSLNEGLYRFGGMYGYVIRDGFVRAEITELTGTVEIARIEVPLVGTTRMGNKPGRETRNGTMRMQKIDGYWENEVYKFLSQSLADRRRARGTAEARMRPFNIQVWLDDPDALGAEVWQLEGCLLWQMPLGFNIGTDILELEFPFTWEKETPLNLFAANHGADRNRDTGWPTIETLYSTTT